MIRRRQRLAGLALVAFLLPTLAQAAGRPWKPAKPGIVEILKGLLKTYLPPEIAPLWGPTIDPNGSTTKCEACGPDAEPGQPAKVSSEH